MLSNEPSSESSLAEEDWIDVSIRLHDGMVHWPGDPPVRIERVLDIERGDAANVSKIAMGSHTGTHMDAPLHFVRGGKSIDEMPLTAVIGRARVIEIHDPESIKPHDLRRHEIRNGERVLFKTRNSAQSWQKGTFVEDFVYISQVELTRHHGHPNIEDIRSSERSFGCQGQNHVIPRSSRKRPYNCFALRADLSLS